MFDNIKKMFYICIMNDAIKSAIISFLDKKGLVTENTYKVLVQDSDKLKYIRDKINESLLVCRKNIVKSNINLLNERIFKGDDEGAIEVLYNTKDKTVFYDYIESVNDLLLKFQEYENCLDFESSELSTIKSNFFLKDEEVISLINEIYLDNR